MKGRGLNAKNFVVVVEMHTLILCPSPETLCNHVASISRKEPRQYDLCLGSGRVLYDVSKKFVENISNMLGNKIELGKAEYALYVLLPGKEVLGFQNKETAAVNTAERFLKDQR